MKKYWLAFISLSFILLLLLPVVLTAQLLNTWVTGSNVSNQNGVYGTQNIADAANTPGGRVNSTTWSDTYGNLWLFGGTGYPATGSTTNALNDLWKYNPATNQWTWVNGSTDIGQAGTYGTKGTPAVGNIPGARQYAISWKDASGNFWLFGGVNGSSYFNDLWKYNPTSNLWTWVSGSSSTNKNGAYGIKGTPDIGNVPGSRVAAVSWVDASGNFWLFGGFGYTASSGNNYLNDLWKYDPINNSWTWISGSSSANKNGAYGIKGTPDIGNIPGARVYSTGWTDASGNFWLFGGNGYAASGSASVLNDLWKYDFTNNSWTWIKGSSSTGQTDVYGTEGISDPANIPGGRQSMTSLTDAYGNFWLFGGYTSSYCNDVWKYNTTTNQWTWMGGSNVTNQNGIYGSQDTANASNIPGAREDAMSWADASGNLWLFGGLGYDAGFTSNANYLNDLWSINPYNTWLGTSNTNWSNASNWSYDTVPGNTDIAIIPSFGVTNEPTLNDNVTIKGLALQKGRTLTLSSNDTLSITGFLSNDAVAEGVGAIALTGSSTQTINSTGTLSNLTVNNNSARVTILDNLSLTGTLTINNGASLFLVDTLQTTGTITNNGVFNAVSGTVVFNGTVAQTLPANTFFDNTLENLTVNNTAGVTLNSNTTVTNLLTLANGKVKINNDTLALSDGASVSGASVSSYVNGTITKAGSQAFVFPIGDSDNYAPIAMLAPSSASVFSASYIASDPHVAYSSASIDPLLYNISSTKYWVLSRLTGSGNVAVTLYWDSTRNDTIINAADLRVAGLVSNTWVDEGNTLTTGTTTSGTVQSNAGLSSYGAFTLGLTVNVLPLTLLSFSAQQQNSTVTLYWQTASEINTSKFDIERSVDNTNFISIGSINAIGNGNNDYTFKDDIDSLKNVTVYYRLKMIDKDGSFTYSKIIGIALKPKQTTLNVYPNPVVNNRITIDAGNTFVTPLLYSIYDVLGKVVLQGEIVSRYNIVDLSTITAGTYLIQLSNGQCFKVVKH